MDKKSNLKQMNFYYGVKIEFDKGKVDSIISESIKNKIKGYVCSVERNVFTTCINDEYYSKIVNNALVNICDGNFVAKTVNMGYRKKFKPYIGADLFISYIKKKKYKQYFLGNTPEILNGLKYELSKIDPSLKTMIFKTLPFKNVSDFNYKEIAKNINIEKPDIIWISLGAPKQEVFMSLLEKHLSHGVMFGFGAIFNFYSGLKGHSRAPKLFLNLKLEWLYRIFQEPKKNILRNWNFIKIIPGLIISKRMNRKI